MATVSFTYSIPATDSSYAWSNPSNWSSQQVPFPGTAIIIGENPPGAVSFDDLAFNPVMFSVTVGAIVGATTITPTLEIAPGDTLTAGNVTDYGTINIDSGAALVVRTGGALNNLGTVVLGADSTLQFRDLSNSGTYDYHLNPNANIFLSAPTRGDIFDATVTGFAPTDNILFVGSQFTSPLYSGYQAVLNGTTLQVQGIVNSSTLVSLYTLDDFHDTGVTSFNVFRTTAINSLTGRTQKVLELDAVCFAAGTSIETDRGPMAIEDIKPGDQVVTVAGGTHLLKPVRWVGERRLAISTQPHRESLYPIRIRRHALADALPARDLLVSPNHCLLIEGQLIPAKLLTNGMTIVQDRSTDAICYHHLELDGHDAVLAEGVAAETYLDTGNRRFFPGNGAIDLFPDLSINPGLPAWQDRLCAPLRLRSEEIEPVWQRIAARAEALGHTRTPAGATTDPDLRIAVGDREYAPLHRSGRRFTFLLPRADQPLRLLSRSAIPYERDRASNDWRRLGVAVRRIAFRSQTAGQLDLPADHPGMTQGWYQAEQVGAELWRWTNGDAIVPLPPTLAGTDLVLEVQLVGRMAYPNMEAETERLAA